MKKRICLMAITVFLLVSCFAGTTFAAEDDVLYTFESLNSTGELTGNQAGLLGKNGCVYDADTGILTLSSANAENLFLRDAKIDPSIDQFTISVEFTVPTFSNGTILEAIILLGETRATNNHHRIAFKDVDRSTTSNRPMYLLYNRRAVNTYNEQTSNIETGMVFNTGEWVRVDLLVDETAKTIDVYLNKTKLYTLSDINTGALALDGRVGFRGKGVSWKNLKVSKGLVDPTAPVATPEPTPVATPEPTPVATPEPTPVATPEPTPVETPVITPTPEVTKVPADNPNTSDGSSLIPLVIIALVVAGGLLFLGVKKNKVTE